jgi:DNA topoisomerase-1
VSKNVVIVESPSKIASVGKYLGKDYEVFASNGHIRDLPSKNGSVKPDEQFSMIWEFNAKGLKSLASIEKAIKKADNLYLATDPDREGEAISWHVVDALKERGVLKDKKIYRVVFNEITKTAVQNGVKNPRVISQPLVDAYLARRALDYLVGFTLSPVLWRKLPGARSAGRVQSVSLRLIVEREDEIERFNTQEYWSIVGTFNSPKGEKFDARLTHLSGKKLDKFDISSEELAKNAVKLVENEQYHIQNVEKKSKIRNPAAPFITSTLQQEAARKLGFSSKKTMQLAQKLYEGISLNGENVGLITYMRTDSVNLSQDALTNIRDFIGKKYKADYLPKEARVYKGRAKNAQEAHEAIRPTDINILPKDIKNTLDDDHIRLYELIWKRSLASQMASAIFDQVSINISSADLKNTFRASGSTLMFDGFLSVYQEGKDVEEKTEDKVDDDEQATLPILNKDDKTPLDKTVPNQHFTQPPPRYSEASLVKKLEELGIGRPSTYVSIIQVLQDRQYVRLEKKQFRPNDRGRIVTSFLKHHFQKYVEYDFTANLEEQLDDISTSALPWLSVMNEFWKNFHDTTKKAMEISVTSVIDEVEKDLEFYLFKNAESRVCPTCSKGQINLKLSKYGAFLGCSEYPTCSYTKPLVEDGEMPENAIEAANKFEQKLMGEIPETGQKIFLKKGPYGFYLEVDIFGKQKKPKRVAVPPTVNINDIDLKFSIDLCSLPKKLGEHPEYGELKIGLGRFGPYVQFKDGFASIPKAFEFLSVTFDQAADIVMKKLEKGKDKKVGKKG